MSRLVAQLWGEESRARKIHWRSKVTLSCIGSNDVDLVIAFFGNNLKQVISSFFTLTLNFREKFISSFYLLSILSSLDFFNLSFKGQYEPHWDHQSYPGAQSSWDENQGSRIATWLTYMSQEMSILTKTFVNSLNSLLTCL